MQCRDRTTLARCCRRHASRPAPQQQLAWRHPTMQCGQGPCTRQPRRRRVARRTVGRSTRGRCGCGEGLGGASTTTSPEDAPTAMPCTCIPQPETAPEAPQRSDQAGTRVERHQRRRRRHRHRHQPGESRGQCSVKRAEMPSAWQHLSLHQAVRAGGPADARCGASQRHPPCVWVAGAASTACVSSTAA